MELVSGNKYLESGGDEDESEDGENNEGEEEGSEEALYCCSRLNLVTTTTVLVMTNLESWMRQLIHERSEILLCLIHDNYFLFPSIKKVM